MKTKRMALWFLPLLILGCGEAEDDRRLSLDEAVEIAVAARGSAFTANRDALLERHDREALRELLKEQG